MGAGAAGHRSPMFVFFSNRLGCLGSLLVTVVGSVLLIGLLLLVNGR